MIVRPATLDDFRGIREVSIAAGQPTVESGADADYVKLLLATANVAVATDQTDGMIAWGATRDGQLGSLLSDLFVHPAHHGKGVGQAMLRELWPGPPIRRY